MYRFMDLLANDGCLGNVARHQMAERHVENDLILWYIRQRMHTTVVVRVVLKVHLRELDG
jgi:hypothetical protein